LKTICRRRDGGGLAGLRVRRASALLAAALVVSVLSAAPSAWAATAALPRDVPNVLDPKVQADYQPYQVGNLEGNPDFPLILFMSRGREKPAAVVVAIDARNGRETWSITSDPIPAQSSSPDCTSTADSPSAARRPGPSAHPRGRTATRCRTSCGPSPAREGRRTCNHSTACKFPRGSSPRQPASSPGPSRPAIA
jgi:hypothetical protein